MVEAFFGLRKRPFPAVPRLESYVATAASAGAISAGVHCLERGDGPVLLVGGAGLGKTLCLMKIAERLQSRMQVSLIAGSQICTRRALLQTVLFHLGLPCGETDEGRLRLSILSHVRSYGLEARPKLKAYPRGAVGHGGEDSAVSSLVLLFDEAQTLSVKLLDEIRVLTNVIGEEGSCVRVVFAGTHKLEDTLAHPQLESLNQRIGLRAYLAPLHHAEVREYMAGKLAVVGGSLDRVFSAESVEVIYRASEGIPRLVDQLADQSMDSAARAGELLISADRVREVWGRLHQLPVTWGPLSPGSVGDEEKGSSIEYGDLEDASGDVIEDALGDQEVHLNEVGEIEEGLDVERLVVEHSSEQTEDLPEYCEESESRESLVDPELFSKGASTTDEDEFDTRGVGASAGLSGKNYFESFMLDRSETRVMPLATHMDEAFRGLIASMHFEALRLDPRDRRGVTEGRRRGGGVVVGESVDGDDRDMLVVVDGEYGDYPYVVREFQPRVS